MAGPLRLCAFARTAVRTRKSVSRKGAKAAKGGARRLIFKDHKRRPRFKPSLRRRRINQYTDLITVPGFIFLAASMDRAAREVCVALTPALCSHARLRFQKLSRGPALKSPADEK